MFTGGFCLPVNIPKKIKKQSPGKRRDFVGNSGGAYTYVPLFSAQHGRLTHEVREPPQLGKVCKSLANCIFQCTQPFNLQLHHVALFEESGGGKAHSHTGTRTCRDNITCQEHCPF